MFLKLQQYDEDSSNWVHSDCEIQNLLEYTGNGGPFERLFIYLSTLSIGATLREKRVN